MFSELICSNCASVIDSRKSANSFSYLLLNSFFICLLRSFINLMFDALFFSARVGPFSALASACSSSCSCILVRSSCIRRVSTSIILTVSLFANGAITSLYSSSNSRGIKSIFIDNISLAASTNARTEAPSLAFFNAFLAPFLFFLAVVISSSVPALSYIFATLSTKAWTAASLS